MNSKKKILSTVIGFFMGGMGSQGFAQDATGGQSEWVLEEIVVTATKRSTGIQDTAMSISAVSGEAIDKRGLVGMDDYLRTLPGVSMQDRGAGQNSVVIRGVASNPQGSEPSPTGIYFGEIPVVDLGASTAGDVSGSADLKLVDIERVEVLRGPQGTLYGSGSMGGTVRVVPNSPDLSNMEGRVATRLSQTSGDGGTNTMVQGVISVPLIEDELAIRAVAYQFDNSGYIQNVAADQPEALDGAFFNPVDLGGVPSTNDDVGNDEYSGVRLTALWKPVDDLSVTLSHIQQEIDQDGRPEVNLGLDGDFQQVRITSGAVNGFGDEAINTDLEINNLVINYENEWGSIFSSSSVIDSNNLTGADISAAFLGVPSFQVTTIGVDSFIQELRFVSDFEGALQLTAGIYYDDREYSDSSSTFWAGDPGLEASTILPILGASSIETLTTKEEDIKQKAVFAEVSYDINDQLKATVGARYFEYEQREVLNGDGALSLIQEELVVSNDDDGESYKFNLEYTPNDDTLIYGQWAEGFRLGSTLLPLRSDCLGPDGTIIGLGFRPQEEVEPDNLESFELGLKTTLAEGRVTVNTSVYRINWEGIPVSITAPCGVATTLNAGESKSEGIEAEVRVHVSESILLDFSTSYGESILTESHPDLGDSGDSLPGSSDFNVSVGLEYSFMLLEYDAFVRGDYAYISEYYNNIDESGEASGGFGELNLRAGIAAGQFDIDLFVNNLTDEDGFTWVESTFAGVGSNRGYRIRPRTIGVNVAYSF